MGWGLEVEKVGDGELREDGCREGGWRSEEVVVEGDRGVGWLGEAFEGD